jgi:hypothetical protein
MILAPNIAFSVQRTTYQRTTYNVQRTTYYNFLASKLANLHYFLFFIFYQILFFIIFFINQ